MAQARRNDTRTLEAQQNARRMGLSSIGSNYATRNVQAAATDTGKAFVAHATNADELIAS
jgi:hypothetical protein